MVAKVSFGFGVVVFFSNPTRVFFLAVEMRRTGLRFGTGSDPAPQQVRVKSSSSEKPLI